MNKGSIVERLCSDLIAKNRDKNGLLFTAFPHWPLILKIEDGERMPFGFGMPAFCSGLSFFRDILQKTQNLRLMTVEFENFLIVGNSRWRTTAVLNIVVSPYFSEMLSDIDEISALINRVGQ